jgi:8-amino-3,8-dideoxy-alpha-D-manno-octulosonate transaminase
VENLKKGGVDGCFYWYDNNWHYIRQWEHFKTISSTAKLPIQLLENRPDYQKLHLPQSDRIMSRTISMQIKLSWTKRELDQRIEKTVQAIKG